MHKTHARRQKNIKTKLMAAICMLLVSSIMMVSTTYAWFTLSTAPEVTGINTAVGANGNLEMALLPTSGSVDAIGSGVGDSMASQAAYLSNTTWGNLVDLAPMGDGTDMYGLTKISLFPSALNPATKDASGNPLTLADTMLKTPAYGADGRVSELKADTVTSTYVVDGNSGSFPQNTEYGVRAVGAASGMTDRQLAYRNYRSTASTAMAQAKAFASSSLNANGAALANIAVAHAVNASATHTQADVNALKAIVTDLLGDDDTTGVLDYIDNAYVSYIIALAASGNSGLTDDAFGGFEGSVNALTDANTNGTKLDEVVSFLGTQGRTLPDPIGAAITQLIATRATVAGALSDLNALSGDAITWAQISVPLLKLADIDAMTVCGIAVPTIKDNMQALVDAVLAGDGVNVVISTGGGVYADVADHCGDFSASITLNNISYGGMTVNEMTARMVTNTTVDDTPNGTTQWGAVYLNLLANAVTTGGAPSSEGGQTMPISDFYGYIIDLAFRTNAAGSNLLLQQDAIDRIYSDNAADAETMGHGSSMTFVSTTTDFTTDQMKNLMGAIRIIFFEPMSKNVLATAKLDVNNATVTGGNTVEAKMYLYKTTTGDTYVAGTYTGADQSYYTLVVSYTDIDDATAATYEGQLYILESGSYNPTSYVADSGLTYYTRSESYSPIDATAASTYEGQLYVIQGAGDVRLTDNVITSLVQNTATAVSVLVYLDGETITNADVAATAATSMTGTMNLQFSSSATLVPMEYTPLVSQGTPAGGGEADGG